jgi:serine/threonine protein kinase
MSLAFKRIRPINDNSISNAYQALISEVCILGQRPIRDHPHILRLQGVCFEAPSGETDVWPVLVFEKAKYGSLKEFMEIERGSTLTFHQRLGMIYEIISAIALVHSSS